MRDTEKEREGERGRESDRVGGSATVREKGRSGRGVLALRRAGRFLEQISFGEASALL